jgi:RNA polymerase sigma-70 factor (ECF subfamily)
MTSRRLLPRGTVEVGPGRDYEVAHDESLIAWSAEGDRSAFGVIVGRRGGRAFRIAYRILQDRAAAEDIAQEAMLRVWEHADRFDPEKGRFMTWLDRIVVNLAIDRKRLPVAEPLDRALEMPDPAPGAEEHLARHQRRMLIWKALGELPRRQRVALVLTYQEGLSGADAVRVMGVTPKALERLLARGRTLLRERLAGIM